MAAVLLQSAITLGAVSTLAGTALAGTKTIQDLGTLGGASSFATGINENGVVVGRSTVAAGDTHAFVYKPWTGTMEDLGTLGGNYSQAAAIGNSNVAVGSSTVNPGDYWAKPVTWDTNNGNAIAILPELTSPAGMFCSQASSINNDGVIAGASAGKAVRWVGGEIEVLYEIEGVSCFGVDINSAGDVLIQCTGLAPRGFVWHGGTVTEIENFGSGTFAVNAINGAGTVVGYGQKSDGTFGAFSWHAGVLSELASFGGYANGHDISESGVIAGEAVVGYMPHAVWWNWNGEIEELGGLSGSNFSSATGITSGAIVTGVSYVDSGDPQTSGFHAVIWK